MPSQVQTNLNLSIFLFSCKSKLMLSLLTITFHPNVFYSVFGGSPSILPAIK